MNAELKIGTEVRVGVGLMPELHDSRKRIRVGMRGVVRRVLGATRALPAEYVVKLEGQRAHEWFDREELRKVPSR